MSHTRMLVIILIAASAAVLPAAALGITLDTIEAANLVVAGTVTAVDDASAEVSISAVLDSKLSQQAISVSPSRVAEGCVGGPRRNYVTNEEVVLFLKDSGDGKFTVVDYGTGKISLDATKAAQIEAVKKLIGIARLTDEDAKNRAMLANTTSRDKLLRSVSQSYVIMRMRFSKSSQKCKSELVTLLESRGDDVRLAALYGLERVTAEEAVPLITQATKDTNTLIAQQASIVLSHYDTPQTLAVLTGLAKQGDRQMRVRAIIDIGNHSTRPEATAVLISLMDDKDPFVRGHAANALVGALRRKAADSAIPRLISLLKDSDDEVRMYAALALGESRKTAALKPLLDFLRSDAKKTRSYPTAVQAVYVIFWDSAPDEASRRQTVQDNLSLITDALYEGDWVAPSCALGILGRLATQEAIAEIKKAAENHPSTEIRSEAKDWLAKSGK